MSETNRSNERKFCEGEPRKSGPESAWRGWQMDLLAQWITFAINRGPSGETEILIEGTKDTEEFRKGGWTTPICFPIEAPDTDEESEVYEWTEQGLRMRVVTYLGDFPVYVRPYYQEGATRGSRWWLEWTMPPNPFSKEEQSGTEGDLPRLIAPEGSLTYLKPIKH